jgi:3-phosphoglycerate kinase
MPTLSETAAGNFAFHNMKHGSISVLIIENSRRRVNGKKQTNETIFFSGFWHNGERFRNVAFGVAKRRPLFYNVERQSNE